MIAILATILILVMVAFLASEGLFSAMILAVLSTVCAAFALNTYPVLAKLLAPSQGAYADPVAAIALFLVPLILGRVLLDLVVRRNVTFGLWTDRIGAGAFGLLASIVLVGTTLAIMQMLPFGESVLGYRPYDDTLARSQRAYPFCPDDVAVGLTRLLSRGVLSTNAGFDKAHDDFLLECFCARNTAGKNGGVHARPGALTLQGVFEPPPPADESDWLAKVPGNPAAQGAGSTKVLVLACSVDSSVDEADGWRRLVGTHFRLVTGPPPAGAKATTEPSILGTTGGGASAAAEAPEDVAHSYYPLGHLTPNAEGTKWVFVGPPGKSGEPFEPARLIVEQEKSAAWPVHWVYRIPEKEHPSYVVFRRVVWEPAIRIKKVVPPVVKRPTKAVKTGKTEPPAKKPPAKTTKDTKATKGTPGAPRDNKGTRDPAKDAKGAKEAPKDAKAAPPPPKEKAPKDAKTDPPAPKDKAPKDANDAGKAKDDDKAGK